MSGTSQSDVNPASRMGATNLTASASSGILSGSFVIPLDTSSGSPTPLIFAAGPVSRGGTPLRHDNYASSAVDLAAAGQQALAVSAGGDTQAKKDVSCITLHYKALTSTESAQLMGRECRLGCVCCFAAPALLRFS